MKKTDHCELCEHQKIDFLHGSFCGLTDRKPDFNSTCSKIKLTDKFEEKLKRINIEYEKVRRSKLLTYIYFVVFVFISVGVILIGYYLWLYVSDISLFSVASVAPFIIMALSVIPLGMAFGALNNLHSELKNTKVKKQKLDTVLELYNIDYDIEIRFGKKYHGKQDVEAELTLFNP